SLVAARPDVDVLILRQAGSHYGSELAGRIVNLYTVQVINRAGREHQVDIRVSSLEGATLNGAGPMRDIAPYALIEGRVLVSVPASHLSGAATAVRFDVFVDGHVERSIESSLIGPGAAGQTGGTRP